MIFSFFYVCIGISPWICLKMLSTHSTSWKSSPITATSLVEQLRDTYPATSSMNSSTEHKKLLQYYSYCIELVSWSDLIMCMYNKIMYVC